MIAFVIMLSSTVPPGIVSAAPMNAAQGAGFDAASGGSLGNGDLQEGLSVKGTNGFGRLLADKLSQEAAEQLENNGCNIFSIEMDGQTANVAFETAEDATLIVGIYDEPGVHMLLSASADVAAGDT